MKIKISPSSLNCNCLRYHWALFQRMQSEGLPMPQAEFGSRVEDIAVQAIREGASTYEIDGRVVPVPSLFLSANKLEFQREVDYCIGDDINIHGYLDCLLENDEGRSVVEMKSSHSLAGAAHTWQKQISAYAYPFYDEGIRSYVFFIRYGVLVEVPVMNPQRFESYIIRLVKEISDAVNAGKEPHTKPSGFCFFCPFALSCPTRPQITSLNGEELMEEYVKAQAKLKQIEQALRELCDREGDVVTSLGVAGHFPQESVEVTPEFWGLLNEFGIDPVSEGVVSISKRGVERLVKRRIPEAANFVHWNVDKTRFGVKVNKKKEEEED